MRDALSDTTVLSNFAHAQRPDLLRTLFASLYVPASVLEELAQGERGGLIPKADWGWLEVVSLNPAELAVSEQLQRQVDLGEAECLAVAQERGMTLGEGVAFDVEVLPSLVAPERLLDKRNQFVDRPLGTRAGEYLLASVLSDLRADLNLHSSLG